MRYSLRRNVRERSDAIASFQEMRGGPHEADSQHRKPDPPPRKALRGDDPGATLKSAVRTAWSAVALVSMWVLASASWFAQVNATLLPMESGWAPSRPATTRTSLLFKAIHWQTSMLF
jgi:hypothetical protein